MDGNKKIKKNNPSVSDIKKNETITITKKELITFIQDLDSGSGGWSDTSKRIVLFLETDET